jgi:DNA-directed RNA polymerase sigma subunit (sigma70/sigma32)
MAELMNQNYYIIKLKDYDLHFSNEHFMLLGNRERKVLELRFALNGHKKMTLKETGKLIENKIYKGQSLSRERVRQIEAKALRKLRNKSRHIKIIIHHKYTSMRLNRKIKRNLNEQT